MYFLRKSKEALYKEIKVRNDDSLKKGLWGYCISPKRARKRALLHEAAAAIAGIACSTLLFYPFVLIFLI